MEVHLRYEPAKHWRTGRPGYYKVCWANGPSYDGMKICVNAIMASGRLDLIDVETLALERQGGGRVALAALLQHLDRGADVSEHVRLRTHSGFSGRTFSYHGLEDHARRMWDATEYPEKLLPRWKARMDALHRVEGEHFGRDRGYRSGYDLLAERLRHDDWPASERGLTRQHPDLTTRT